MKNELTDVEMRILEALFPDKKWWYRKFLSECGIADKPLRRSLKTLLKRGYIARTKPRHWKQGMKKRYSLTLAGKDVATRVIIGNEGRKIFLQVLDKVNEIAKIPDDEGEEVLELAVDIVNMLWDQKKSDTLRDYLYRYFGSNLNQGDIAKKEHD